MTVVRTVRSLRSCAETQAIILCSAHDKIAHNRKWDGRGVVEGRGRFIVEQPLTFGETLLEIAHLLFQVQEDRSRSFTLRSE